MFGETTISYEKMGDRPVETTIYKWLALGFQVGKQSLYCISFFTCWPLRHGESRTLSCFKCSSRVPPPKSASPLLGAAGVKKSKWKMCHVFSNAGDAIMVANLDFQRDFETKNLMQSDQIGGKHDVSYFILLPTYIRL